MPIGGCAKGEWPYRAGAAANIHGEIGGKTLGLLGFGHIGRAVAARAKAFGMTIHVANRSPVPVAGDVDASHGLDDLAAFYAAADFVVVSLPLLPETRGLVDAAAFDLMRPNAVLVNVGRGPVVHEAALYEALTHRRIGGAVIDTWYRYPEAEGEVTAPSRFDFAALDNVLMTPHMSAWTDWHHTAAPGHHGGQHQSPFHRPGLQQRRAAGLLSPCQAH